MDRKNNWLRKGWWLAAIVLALSLACGDISQPPYGSEVVLPSNSTIKTNDDVIFYIGAMVLDEEGNPMNGMEVLFLVCCGGGEIVGGGTSTKEKTNDSGVAEIAVRVFGEYSGEVYISADIGITSSQTKISKSLLDETS